MTLSSYLIQINNIFLFKENLCDVATRLLGHPNNDPPNPAYYTMQSKLLSDLRKMMNIVAIQLATV